MSFKSPRILQAIRAVKLMAEILLTADRTLMSNYHGKEFLGFGSTAPPILPECIIKALFFPPVKNKRGIPLEAPYGLRKVEAKLIEEGFNVLTVDPDGLCSFIDEAKALGVYTMDPLGWGPSSTTFASIMKVGEPCTAIYFRRLLTKPEVRRARRRGLKVIVGGPGAWQLKHKPKALNDYGIDCVIDGEAERVVGRIFRMALNGDELPKFYDVDLKDVPSVDEIPDIISPSVNGLIEIGRGCCRGCHFCDVTLRPLRWYPYEKILRELKVNLRVGIRQAILHAEDVLLYGSNNTVPRDDKVLKLHELCKKYVDSVCWSHASLAAIAVNPKLVRVLSEVILSGRQRMWGAQIGIETGSPKLLKKVMPAKAHPFKPEDWPNVVRTAIGIAHDNNLVPACTLIVGLPEETEDDVVKTIELIDDLRRYRSLIVPLFFVPLGKIKNKDWFKVEHMAELQKELLVKCLRHDVHWVKDIMGEYFSDLRGALIKPLYQLFMKAIEREARRRKVI